MPISVKENYNCHLRVVSEKTEAVSTLYVATIQQCLYYMLVGIVEKQKNRTSV